jgi:hypothetical protein
MAAIAREVLGTILKPITIRQALSELDHCFQIERRLRQMLAELVEAGEVCPECHGEHTVLGKWCLRCIGLGRVDP